MADEHERVDTRQHVRELYGKFFGPITERRERIVTLVAHLPFASFADLLGIIRNTSFEQAMQSQLDVAPFWFLKTRLAYRDLITTPDSVTAIDELIQRVRREDDGSSETFALLVPPDHGRVCRILADAATLMNDRHDLVLREIQHPQPANIAVRANRPFMIFRYWHDGIPLLVQKPPRVQKAT